jgi:serine/threonine protein phosphatase 1
MRDFVIGDIHGAHKALLQCLERAGFDYEKDRLYVLGDVADGWPETAQCCEELSKIKNVVLLMGNHDWWADQWLRTGWHGMIWEEQGGFATKKSFTDNPELMVKHRHFFTDAKIFHIDKKDNLFVHGGIVPDKNLDRHSIRELIWERGLALDNLKKHVRPYNEVFIGHTTVFSKTNSKPVQKQNVWCMDTGAGWEGVLSMMNIDTKELFQSDLVADLYPGVRGRH